MTIATPVKKSEIVPRRPLSWLAAFGLLGVSVYLAHRGLTDLYTPSVAGVLALAFVCLAWLNWQAIARMSEAHAADDTARKVAIAGLSLVMAIAEAWLTHHGFLALAADDGAELAIATAWLFAGGLASLNLWAKYGFVSPIGHVATSQPDMVDSEPPPASRFDDPKVHDLTRRDREIAGYSKERGGLLDIYAQTERARQADLAAIAERKDAKGRWKKRQRRAA